MSFLLRRTLPTASSSRLVLSLSGSTPRRLGASSFLPSPPSTSSSSLSTLLTSLSLSNPTTSLSHRSFSTSTILSTPSNNNLKRKHRQGWDPEKTGTRKHKTHKGAAARFRCYKTGLFKHVRAGGGQLLRKNTHRQTKLAGALIFAGKMQTKKLKKLLPFWKRTRRQGGW
ncbi:hypothetical protein BDY24DRAFT_389006 [Mrakia frigida]|uniref:bL35 family ribosomal protein n=1 Tax=Mrakia frigida TaxID=29902 RepID=UPI003FCC25FD